MEKEFGNELRARFERELKIVEHDLNSAEKFLITRQNERTLSYAPAILFIILPLMTMIFGGFEVLDILTVPLVLAISVMSWQMFTSYYKMIEGDFGTIKLAIEETEKIRNRRNEGLRIDRKNDSDMAKWLDNIENGVEVQNKHKFDGNKKNCKLQIEKLTRKLILCISIAMPNMLLNMLSWPVNEKAISKAEWWVPLLPKYIQSLHIHSNLPTGELYTGLILIFAVIAAVFYLLHTITSN